MKLKYTFEPVDMGNEIIAVPVGSGSGKVHGVIKLNKEGQEILELLREDVSEKQIVDKLSTKYQNNRDTLETWTHNIITTLRDADLIEE